MARLDAAIAERARRQLGLITFEQLDALQCPRGRRRGLIDAGVLEAAGPRLVRVAGAPVDLRQRTLAACLVAGNKAGASHRSAAWLWASPNIGCAEPEISIAGRGHAPGIAAIVHRPRDLRPSELTKIGPIPVTTKLRTIIDCAALLDDRSLETLVDTALRDRTVDRRQLRARAQELHTRGRPGIGRLLALTDPAPAGCGRPESWLERELLGIIRQAGLPKPRTQVHTRTSGGSPRVDLRYDEAWLIIEADGHATHSTRRQRQQDAERRARLTASGWQVLHFTYEDVTERPLYVVGMIRAHLALGD
jgi:very-short-patch-repair endonuclease